MDNDKRIMIIGFDDSDSLLTKAICAAKHYANPEVGTTHMPLAFEEKEFYEIQSNKQMIDNIFEDMIIENIEKKPYGWYRKFEKKRKW
jgi:hypothetical protein